MLKLFIFIAVLQLTSSQITYYSATNYCDHDLCEPNGVCRATNGSYSCKCAPGYRGKHCEIEDCVNGHCKMSVDYCNAYPKVKCLNDGQCVNVAQGFRCRCTSQFEGKYCENEKKPIWLDGEIVVVLSGRREEIIKNLDQVLSQIDQVNNITIHIAINATNKQPIIYSINQEKGNEVVQRQKRNVPQVDEVLLLARIETTNCLELKRINPQLKCPDNVDSAVEQLQQNSQQVNNALKSLNIKILRIFSRNFQKTQNVVIEKKLFVVFCLIFVIVFLLLLIACLLLRKGRSGNLKQNLVDASEQMSVAADDKYSQRSSLSSIVTVESSASTNDAPKLIVAPIMTQIVSNYRKEYVV